MGLGLAFYMLGFLENTAKIVTAQHVIGFCMLSSISLCGGLWDHGMCSSKENDDLSSFPELPITWAMWGTDRAWWHPAAVLSACDILLDLTIILPWSGSSPGFDMETIQCLQQVASGAWSRQTGTGCLHGSHCRCLSRTISSFSSEGWPSISLRIVELLLIHTALAVPALQAHWTPIRKFPGLCFKDVQRNTFEFLTIFLDCLVFTSWGRRTRSLAPCYSLYYTSFYPVMRHHFGV